LRSGLAKYSPCHAAPDAGAGAWVGAGARDGAGARVRVGAGGEAAGCLVGSGVSVGGAGLGEGICVGVLVGAEAAVGKGVGELALVTTAAVVVGVD
jgi:hypothetical protein